MLLPRHHLARALGLALNTTAAHEAPVVEEELQQVQVRAANVATQREVRAQPRVDVLHQRTASRRLRHGTLHRVKDRLELTPQRSAKPTPALPIRLRRARQAMQHERLAHEGLGRVVGLSDGAQLAVEHAGERAGEREQVVAPVLEQPRRHTPGSIQAHASTEKWGASIGHGTRLSALRRVSLG